MTAKKMATIKDLKEYLNGFDENLPLISSNDEMGGYYPRSFDAEDLKGYDPVIEVVAASSGSGFGGQFESLEDMARQLHPEYWEGNYDKVVPLSRDEVTQILLKHAKENLIEAIEKEKTITALPEKYNKAVWTLEMYKERECQVEAIKEWIKMLENGSFKALVI